MSTNINGHVLGGAPSRALPEFLSGIPSQRIHRQPTATVTSVRYPKTMLRISNQPTLTLRVIAPLFAIALARDVADAQNSTRVLEPSIGSVWLEGTFTLGRFKCTATEVRGELRGVDGETREANGSDATITVPVERVRCGNDAMEEDLYRAVNSTVHPNIYYRANRAAVYVADGEARRVVIAGTLELNGVKRPVTVRAVADAPDTPGRVVGSATFLLTEFGVKPPTAMLGLIRAGNKIVIRFDLRLEPILAAARGAENRELVLWSGGGAR